jgi:hypothetical protein
MPNPESGNGTRMMDPFLQEAIEIMDEITAHHINDNGLYDPVTGQVTNPYL